MRFSIVDLLINIACFVWKVNNIFNIKRSWSKLISSTRSIALSLSLGKTPLLDLFRAQRVNLFAEIKKNSSLQYWVSRFIGGKYLSFTLGVKVKGAPVEPNLNTKKFFKGLFACPISPRVFISLKGYPGYEKYLHTTA